jgi:hypothetical protein
MALSYAIITYISRIVVLSSNGQAQALGGCPHPSLEVGTWNGGFSFATQQYNTVLFADLMHHRGPLT